MEVEVKPTDCKQCKSNETKKITLSLFTQCHLMHTKHLRGTLPTGSIGEIPSNHKAKEKKGCYIHSISVNVGQRNALKLGVMSCHCHWNRIWYQRTLNVMSTVIKTLKYFLHIFGCHGTWWYGMWDWLQSHDAILKWITNWDWIGIIELEKGLDSITWLEWDEMTTKMEWLIGVESLQNKEQSTKQNYSSS